MEPDTHNMEGRLCAYIEGELDEAQRAEIEKHLAANPQYRVMLEEIQRTRRLVQGLPRAKAPPELAEALSSQFERAALLGDPDGRESGVAGRIGRWPQFAAIAAVLALAVGLGVVIYSVMRPGNAPPVVTLAKVGAGEENKVESRATTEREVISQDSMMGAPPGGGGQGSGLAPEAAKRDEAAEKDKLLAPASVFDNGMAAKENGSGNTNGSAKGSPGNANPLWVVVSTADASATNAQVTRFLEGNGIEYQAVGASADRLALEQKPAAGNDDSLVQDQARTREAQLKASAAPAAPAPVATGQLDASAGAGREDMASARGVAPVDSVPPPAPAATQPAFGAPGGGGHAGAVADGANQAANASNGVGRTSVYIASMSEVQANMLSDALSKEGYQSAQISREAADGQASLRRQMLPMSMQKPLGSASAASRPGPMQAATSPAAGPVGGQQQMDVVIVVEEKAAPATGPTEIPMDKAGGGR